LSPSLRRWRNWTGEGVGADLEELADRAREVREVEIVVPRERRRRGMVKVVATPAAVQPEAQVAQDRMAGPRS